MVMRVVAVFLVFFFWGGGLLLLFFLFVFFVFFFFFFFFLGGGGLGTAVSYILSLSIMRFTTKMTLLSYFTTSKIRPSKPGTFFHGERGGLVVNASEGGSRGRGFEPHSGQTVLCP